MQKISEYSNERTTLSGTDRLDVSADLGGGSWESQYLQWSTLQTNLTSAGFASDGDNVSNFVNDAGYITTDTNFANTNLTFTANRTHTLGGNTLDLVGSGAVVSALTLENTNIGARTWFNASSDVGDIFVRAHGSNAPQDTIYQGTGMIATGSMPLQNVIAAVAGTAWQVITDTTLSLTSPSVRMTMNSSGEFGFGTTPVASTRMAIGGNTYIDGNLRIDTPTPSVLGQVWTATDAFGNGSWQTPSGGNTLYSADDNLAGNRTVNLNDGLSTDYNLTFAGLTAATLLRLDSSIDRVDVGGSFRINTGVDANNFYVNAGTGKVGIQASSTPSETLVVGNSGIARNYMHIPTTAGNMYIGTESFAYFGETAGTLNVTTATSGKLGIGTFAAEKFIIGTSNTNRIEVSSTGLVGIGTTPSAKLHVGGNAQIDGETFITGSGNSYINNGNLLIGTTTNASNRRFLVDGVLSNVDVQINSGLRNYFEDTNTNFGGAFFSNEIKVNDATYGGTALPSLMINRKGETSVVNDARAVFNLKRFEVSGASARTQLDIRLAHAISGIDTDVISLRSNGNVGIGTTTPSSKLHVNGDVRIDQTTATSKTISTDFLPINVNGTIRYVALYD